MAFEINVHLDITASKQVCWAINNLSNTLVSLMLTAIKEQEKAAEVLAEAAQEATAQTQGYVPSEAELAPQTPAPAPEPAPITPQNTTPAPQTPAPAPVAPAPAPQTPASAPAAVPPASAAVPVATAPPAPAPLPTVPVAATPTYTQNQLALAAGGLMDAGLGDALRALLATFNVPSLVQLPKEQYGAFATELRKMGAKI